MNSCYLILFYIFIYLFYLRVVGGENARTRCWCLCGGDGGDGGGGSGVGGVWGGGAVVLMCHLFVQIWGAAAHECFLRSFVVRPSVSFMFVHPSCLCFLVVLTCVYLLHVFRFYFSFGVPYFTSFFSGAEFYI